MQISYIKLDAACDISEIKKLTGETLRAARKAAGFGVRETAKRLGTSATFICDLEAGRRFPSPEMALKLERVLDQGWDIRSSNSG
jgi:transcriptional regulator with XRE-family HTH domain